MRLNDPLKRIASYYGITVRHFERRPNLANGYVRTIGNSMGANKVESILTAFPDISRVWLLTGEGEMLKNSTGIVDNSPGPEVAPAASPVPDPAPSNDLALRLLALVESQQKTLADNAATIKRLSEEVAAQRLQIAALTEEGIRDVAEGVSPSSLQAVPSPAGSLV